MVEAVAEFLTAAGFTVLYVGRDLRVSRPLVTSNVKYVSMTGDEVLVSLWPNMPVHRRPLCDPGLLDWLVDCLRVTA